jgi:hypothetical protein
MKQEQWSEIDWTQMNWDQEQESLGIWDNRFGKNGPGLGSSHKIIRWIEFFLWKDLKL